MDFIEELAKKKDCIGTWLVSGFGRTDEAHIFYEEIGYRKTGSRFIKDKL